MTKLTVIDTATLKAQDQADFFAATRSWGQARNDWNAKQFGDRKAIALARRDAGKFIDRTLRKLAPTAAGNFHFKRLAVTKTQVDSPKWNLPTRLTKKSDTRAAVFGDNRSVELDAISSTRLRKLVEDAILDHLPADYAELMKEQDAERALIRKLVGKGRLR